jgi:hypothetical protein
MPRPVRVLLIGTLGLFASLASVSCDSAADDDFAGDVFGWHPAPVSAPVAGITVALDHTL